MNKLWRLRFFLWYFGKVKVPMIGYLNPKLIKLDDQELILKIAYKRRSKNHLNSMYFGALTVGADLAGGLHGFYYAKKNNVKASIAFKSFSANFLKRPESDVFFTCKMGDDIEKMIIESAHTHKRINKKIAINAYIINQNNSSNFDFEKVDNMLEVANFILELSIKVIPSFD